MKNDVHLYLAPVIKRTYTTTPDGKPYSSPVTSYEPAALDLFYQADQMVAELSGNDPLGAGYSLIAARVSPQVHAQLIAHPAVTPLTAIPKPTLAETLGSLTVNAVADFPKPKRDVLDAAFAALSLGSIAGKSQAEAIRLIGSRLNRVFNDESFDKPTPEKKATIVDDFNRADGPAGANYVTNERGVMNITSNQLFGFTTAFNSMLRVETSFPNDQWGQIDQPSIASGNAGIVLRSPGPGNYPYYLFRYANSTTIDLRTMTALDTLSSQIGSATISSTGSNTLKGDFTGTTWTIYFNGASVASGADSQIASGRIGIFANFNDFAMDNFQCIDAISVTSPGPPQARTRFVFLS